MKIGVLTGGGDAPGLNTAVYALARLAEARGHELHLFLRGWRGVVEGQRVRARADELRQAAFAGGTHIKTSRTNPFKDEERARKAAENLKEVDVLVAIGGDDTLWAAAEAHRRGLVRTVGIPKTIDNDVWGTDETIGFDTAVNRAAKEAEDFQTTLMSHERIGVMEVMGREAGWIALFTGLAVAADLVLIPEKPVDWDTAARRAAEAAARKGWALVIVGEGVKAGEGPTDEYGHARLGGVAAELAQHIERRTGGEARAVSPGHIVRGAPPTAHDRLLAIRYAHAAMQAIEEGRHGVMTAVQGGRLTYVPLAEVAGRTRLVSGEWLKLYEETYML